MNLALRKLAQQVDLQNQQKPRYALALACAERIRHLLIDPTLIQAHSAAVENFRQQDYPAIRQQAVKVAALAASHRGTNSGDGSGNAAVSASYALARALDGDAISAAEYSAYALVYSYSSHAVTRPEAYQDEYDWQLRELRHILNHVCESNDADGTVVGRALP